MWKQIDSGFTDPKSALLDSYAKNPDELIYKAWGQHLKQGKGGGILHLTNPPGGGKDSCLFLSSEEFREAALKFVPNENLPNDYVIDLALLRRFRVPPPSLIVWFDGRHDGNYVAQLCLHSFSDE